MSDPQNLGVRMTPADPPVSVCFGAQVSDISPSSHVAYFWNDEKEFADGVKFLESGLSASDHCVIFGHDEANQMVCDVLKGRGYDVDSLLASGRITILGGATEASEIIAKIGAVFEKSLAAGASLIRLLGNIGWGRANWPDEKSLLAFEAQVTEAAKQFPCVVLCMYDVAGLPGSIVHHGGIGTHPHIVSNGHAQTNPHHVPTEIFLRRLETVAGAVAERRRNEATLHHISEATVQHVGEDFFRELARHLAEALAVRYCFITECTDDAQTRVRALAFWRGDGFAQNVEYPLRGTPCEKVIEGNICSYPERLQSLFPEDKDLVTLGAESYAGVPLANATGRVLGHLVVMDMRAREFGPAELRILRIFAARAGIELERSRADAALKANQRRLNMILDINNAIVSKLTRDELFAAIADSLARTMRFDRLALSLYDPELKALRIVTHAGAYERPDYTPIGRVLQLDDSPVGQAFVQQKPILRPNLEIDRLTSSEERAYGHGFRSMCALPLIVRGQSIGAITLGSLTPYQYAQTDGDLLLGIASQIAIAVENMQLHEETARLKARYEAEAIYLQEEIKTEHNFEEIIGQSAPVRQLLRKLEQVAPTDATVLIHGETGTGKELLARAVHDRSQRKDRPLVKVNCGSIPSGLVESELFGHEKGAFTGATQRRIGRFELAHGGTIFLDEVTELPLDTQVKLLRVLQEGEFERVGSSQTIKVDVRVIAATNRDLKVVVGNGSLRSDLFYRLNVFPLEVPPLRERKADIALLVNFFLSRFGKKLGKEVRGVERRSLESLVGYSWPGNIRELQNVVERAVVLAAGPVVRLEAAALRENAGQEEPRLATLDDNERAHIQRALGETNWVIHGKKGAAELLGINPSTLRSRMEKLKIKKQP